MRLTKRVPTVLTLALLALTVLLISTPANAQLRNRMYTIEAFGSHINSPFDLIFVGTDCLEFISASVVCAPLLFEDCGVYTVTSVDGPITHFEAQMNFQVGTLITGPITLHGVVDRNGAGSSISFSFGGKIRSPDMSIPPTYTNGSGHGVNGCDMVTGPSSTRLWLPSGN